MLTLAERQSSCLAAPDSQPAVLACAWRAWSNNWPHANSKQQSSNRKKGNQGGLCNHHFSTRQLIMRSTCSTGQSCDVQDLTLRGFIPLKRLHSMQTSRADMNLPSNCHCRISRVAGLALPLARGAGAAAIPAVTSGGLQVVCAPLRFCRTPRDSSGYSASLPPCLPLSATLASSALLLLISKRHL